MHAPAQLMRMTDAIRRWIRVSAGVRCVVVCWVVLSAGPLFASCGDYLFRNGRPVSGHSMAKHADVAEVTEDGVPQQESVPPCSGPNCSSRSIPHLPLSQVPTDPARSLRSDCVLVSQSDRQPANELAEIPQSEQGAFFEPLPVFRPPAA